MSCFVHRRMVVEKVQPIALRIDKFSQVESSGRYSHTVLQDGTSDWTLEVQACGDGVQVCLRRESSTGGEQFVQVRLTVDDWMSSPFSRKSGQKSLTFRGETDFRNVLSFHKSAFNRFWYVPRDTMTIRGELTIYKEVEEEFQARSGTAWKIVAVLGLLSAVAAIGYFTVIAAVSFVLHVVLPFLFNAAALICVFMIVATHAYEMVENYLNGRKQIPKGCPNDRSLVPARSGSAVSAHSPGRFRRNRRMKAYDPRTRRLYEFEESSYSY